MREKGALITGSADGLGYAIAAALAKAGCDVVLHGVEPEDEAGPRARALADAHGVRAAYVRADLSHEQGVDSMLDRARTHIGSIDVLVNNAVVRHFSPIQDFPGDAWERALKVNLTAPFQAVKRLLPDMRARGWGRIINMSSIYGIRGTRDRVDYVTTKAALLGFTRAVAAETAGEGITCNAVCPGSVRTPAIERRLQGLLASGLAAEEAERRFLAGKQPTGRFIDADDVAALIVFLCSPAGRDISGATLPVDGGWLAG